MRYLVLVAISACIASAGTSHAQVAGGGSGWALYGFQNLDIGDLGDHLETLGMPAPGDRFFTTGGGGHAFIGSAIVGGEGVSLFGESQRNDRYITRLSGGFGLAKFGFLAYQTRNLFLYPLVGLGGGQLNLKVTDFDTDPNGITKLSAALFILDLSVGAEYLVEFGGSRKGAGGLIFGIQAGYVMTPSRKLWDLDDERRNVDVGINTIPKIGIDGPYVRFLIGGGGFGYRS